MSNTNIFENVRSAKPKRHYQDLSHSTCFDFEAGKLVPFCCFDCVPGDKVKIGTQLLIRAITPFQAPQLSSLRVKQYWFAVPFRILDENFPDFIAKKDGAIGPKVIADYNDGTTPELRNAWFLRNGYQFQGSLVPAQDDRKFRYSVADYLGLPLVGRNVYVGSTRTDRLLNITDECLAFPWLAYNTIWNERFRDEQLQAERDLMNNTLAKVNWKKDYFTSAFLTQLAGNEPVVSLTQLQLQPSSTITNNALLYRLSFDSVRLGQTTNGAIRPHAANNQTLAAMSSDSSGILRTSGTQTQISNLTVAGNATSGGIDYPNAAIYGRQMDPEAEHNNNAAIFFDEDYTKFVFTPSDMRLAFASQRFQEMLLRGGQRYEEYTRMMFGVSPGDARLQEPEYIGGCSNPVVVSEVIQTGASSGDRKLGTLGGHGIGAGVNYIGSYFCREHCLIMGLMYLAPDLMYSSQGVPKWLSRRVAEDYYTPPFAFLSEQPIFNKELFYQGNGNPADDLVFGYQGIWNDMRCRNDDVRGALRDDLDNEGLNFWHMARKFDNLPELNSDFIEMNPTDRVFGIENVPHWLAACNITIKAFRPMPKYSDPGRAGDVYGMR